ncbi:hypothetical protein L615_011400000020 [Nocardioides sp. J9]|nr:hypothetical protein L615_011400000020 [Nocardioides sp. J9]
MMVAAPARNRTFHDVTVYVPAAGLFAAYVVRNEQVRA